MHIFPSYSSQKKLQSMHANMPNEKHNRQHSAGLFRLKIILTRKVCLLLYKLKLKHTRILGPESTSLNSRSKSADSTEGKTETKVIS
jgi:hypothetical protein